MAEIRVLIVDDQEPFRRAIAAVVAEADGFAVVAATASGEEALLAVARLRPGLVLMDINLPGMDGIEATRRITQDVDPPIVVLLSTYDHDEFDVSSCGAASYLAKAAFGPDLLVAAWVAASTEPIRLAVPIEPVATPPPAQARRHRPEC